MRLVPNGSLTSRTALLILNEHLLIVLSVMVASAIRFSPLSAYGMIAHGDLLWRAMVIALVLQISLHYCDLYDLRIRTGCHDLIIRLVQALGAASLVLSLLYYWVPQLIIGRGVFVIASLFIVALVAGWRISFEWLSLRLRPAERLLIVGIGSAAAELATELFDRRQELGVELVGFVDPEPQRAGTALTNPRVIGTIAEIPQIVRQRRVDRVVLDIADARGKLEMARLLQMKMQDGVQFDHLASVYEEYTGKIAVENLRPSWFIFSDGFKRSAPRAAAKLAIDMGLSLVGLLLALPLMVVAALAVRLSSPGPVFYQQRRVGKDGRVFAIHKFRSMRLDAEAGTGAVFSHVGDPRVTRVGRFLRRTRIDELPQLWNVLRGDMSFVGPRPERPEFVDGLTKEIPFYTQRGVVRPGLTGWAQIRHEYGATLGDALQKLQYDLFYIKHMSMAFDLFILIETVKTVLVRKGS